MTTSLGRCRRRTPGFSLNPCRVRTSCSALSPLTQSHTRPVCGSRTSFRSFCAGDAFAAVLMATTPGSSRRAAFTLILTDSAISGRAFPTAATGREEISLVSVPDARCADEEPDVELRGCRPELLDQ